MNDVPARLLREALREHAAPPPSSACLDAETLAAWSDGALGARDPAAAESHGAAAAAVGLWIAVPRPRPDRQTIAARGSVPASATATRSESRGADASNTP